MPAKSTLGTHLGFSRPHADAPQPAWALVTARILTMHPTGPGGGVGVAERLVEPARPADIVAGHGPTSELAPHRAETIPCGLPLAGGVALVGE